MLIIFLMLMAGGVLLWINQLPTKSNQQNVDESSNLSESSNSQITYGVPDFVVVDVETTGLSPHSDDIIEIAAIKFQSGIEVERFHSLINPGIPLSPRIVGLTGITDNMLSDSPTIENILLKFLEFLGEQHLVAHNAKFDTDFIESSARRYLGITVDIAYIDTLGLCRRCFPSFQNHKLATVAKNLNIQERATHRAMADAVVTAKVFDHLQRNFHLAISYIPPSSVAPKTTKPKEDVFTFPLVNLRSKETQLNISSCSVGDIVTYRFDEQLKKHAVFVDDKKIGCFTSGINTLLRNNPNAPAKISAITKDDSEKFCVDVTITFVR